MSCPVSLLLTRIRIVVLIWAAFIFVCSPAHATSSLDVTTGLKIFLLLKNEEPTRVTVAIAFNPVEQKSRADAEAIKNYIDNGSALSGSFSLTTKLVNAANTVELQGSQIVFLAEGIPPEGVEPICDAASKSGALTISTGIDCVKAHKCVLGIVTAPRTEVYYSEEAAQAAHLRFYESFLMLVKQL